MEKIELSKIGSRNVRELVLSALRARESDEVMSYTEAYSGERA